MPKLNRRPSPSGWRADKKTRRAAITLLHLGPRRLGSCIALSGFRNSLERVWKLPGAGLNRPIGAEIQTSNTNTQYLPHPEYSPNTSRNRVAYSLTGYTQLSRIAPPAYGHPPAVLQPRVAQCYQGVTSVILGRYYSVLPTPKGSAGRREQISGISAVW